MSDTTHGWETWVRFAKQAGQGTVGSTWHTYDADDADSLTMGEVPIDRTSIHGRRKRPESSYRRGHYMPGGALGAYPFHLATGTGLAALDIPLLFKCHCGSYAVSSGGGTAESTLTYTPVTTQVATADWPYLTFQKDTGISAKGEQYLDSWIDELSIAWSVDAQYMTITPTIKSLSGGTASTITGDGTAITAGFYDASTVNFTWQGTAIYPTALDFTSSQNTPDGMAASVRGRKRVSVGDFTGIVNLSMPRDGDLATWFVDQYGNATQGTLIVSGTLSTDYGTTLSGNPLTFALTTYLMVNPTAQPTGQGEMIDSIAFTMNDWSLSHVSDLTTV